MESKSIAKGNHAWGTASTRLKASFVPNMELVTENVFIPITKVIFQRKREPIHRDRSKRKIKVVNACQCCNSNVTMSLLKRPFCLAVKRYASAVSYSKQTNKSNECEKRTMSKKPSWIISKRSAFVNIRSKAFTQRSESKKRQALLFPSSISDLPLTTYAKCKSLSTREGDPIKSNEFDKSDKVDGTGAKYIASNFSKGNNSCKKPQLKKKTANAMHRLLNHPATMLNGIWNVSISTPTPTPTLTTIASTDVNAARCIARKNVEEQCPSVSNRQLAWRETEATANGTIGSNETIHYGEEIKFPVRRIESNTFTHGRSIAFHLSQPNSFSATKISTLDNVHGETASPTRNISRPSWEQVDNSILSLLTRKQYQYRNDTELGEEEHRRPYRIKYSWQVIGTSSQTSRTLLESLVKENSFLDDESICNCSVKYSWQIIGIATQTSIKDFTLSGCRSVVPFSSAKSNNVCRNTNATRDAPVVATVWRNGQKFIVLNNQYTQTFAHKDSQTIFTEFYAR